MAEIERSVGMLLGVERAVTDVEHFHCPDRSSIGLQDLVGGAERDAGSRGRRLSLRRRRLWSRRRSV